MVVVLTSHSTKEEIEEALKKVEKNGPEPRYKSSKEFDAERYCGLLKLAEDPLAVQKGWRDEW